VRKRFPDARIARRLGSSETPDPSENQQDFFATELPLRVIFKVHNNNLVTGLLIYPPRGQKAVPANKLAAEK
jgi:hypothetical protein